MSKFIQQLYFDFCTFDEWQPWSGNDSRPQILVVYLHAMKPALTSAQSGLRGWRPPSCKQVGCQGDSDTWSENWSSRDLVLFITPSGDLVSHGQWKIKLEARLRWFLLARVSRNLALTCCQAESSDGIFVFYVRRILRHPNSLLPCIMDLWSKWWC